MRNARWYRGTSPARCWSIAASPLDTAAAIAQLGSHWAGDIGFRRPLRLHRSRYGVQTHLLPLMATYQRISLGLAVLLSLSWCRANNTCDNVCEEVSDSDPSDSACSSLSGCSIMIPVRYAAAAFAAGVARRC